MGRLDVLLNVSLQAHTSIACRWSAPERQGGTVNRSDVLLDVTPETPYVGAVRILEQL